MEYRQLGDSGLRVSALTLGTMTFGGKGWAQAVGNTDVDGREAAGRDGPRRGRQPDRHRGRLLRGPVGGDPRRGARRAGATTCWWRPRCACRWAAGPTTPACRGTTSCAAARPACAGCGPTGSTCTRRTSGTARRRWRRRSRRSTTLVALGQGPLRRLLELHRLAADEGARRRRPARLQPVRQPADLLLAAGPRRRGRAGAGQRRPGPRHPGLEPAGRRPAVRQVPARPAERRRAPAGSPAGTSRRCTTRTGSTTPSTRWSRSARRTASRRRRSRSPGCSAGRR